MQKLLLSYAKDLDDAYPGYEFSIWSAERLLGYFNEALCLIATHRPDFFTEEKIIKVEACNDFLDLCGCVKVLDVLGQTDVNGKNIRQIPRRKEKSALWTGNKRKTEYTDKISEYELLDKSNLIRIYPTNLDPTKDLYVKIRCSVPPKQYSLDDAAPDERCAFMAAARLWVLYNAKNVDGAFSQAMGTQAREHRDMFMAILGLVKQGDDEFDEKLRGLPVQVKRKR